MKNIFLIVFFLLTVPLLHAQEFDNSYRVKIGLFPLHPLNFTDQDGDALGLYPDLIREVARYQNWSVEFVPGSWAKGLERLQTGEIDLVTTIAFSPERAESMDFSREPVVDIWSQIFALPKSKIESFNDLVGTRVGIMRKDMNAANFLKAIDKLGISCTIVEYDDHSDVLHAVHDSEVIAGVAPNYYGYRHAKDFGLVAAPILLPPFSVYFAVKKGEHHDLLKHLDSYIIRWKLDKESIYHKRLSYWMGGEEYHKEIIPHWLIAVLLIVTSIAGLLFFLNRMLNIKVAKRTGELHASEQKYRQLVENAHNIIIRWDGDGTILFINKFGLEFFGYSEEDIIGQNLNDTIVPETDRHGKDLHEMIIDISRNPEEYSLNENENICRDGSRVFIQWTNQVIPSDSGDGFEVLSVGTDATKRKELEYALAQSQKMEAIGTLAGGIAHDFNNLLGIITGNADLALEDIPRDNPAREDVGRILIACDNAKKLVQQILTYSRQDQNTEMLPLKPCPTIDEALSFLRSATPSSVEIIQHNCDRDCTIEVDLTQFHQLLMNLFSNAIDAMNENGILEVSGSVVDLDIDDIPPDFSASPGKFFKLSVRDTGTGIAPENVKRIFDPFFTIKDVNEGTGMGLAIVMGIVLYHKGLVTVDTELGKGSQFNVYFPVVVDSLEDDHQKQDITGEIKMRGKENILFVDDEEMLAHTCSRILEKLGYQVTAFTNPVEALKKFQKKPKLYDLVITDQTMPGMTGSELSAEFLRIRPDIPIIMCTGYSKTFSEKDASSIGIKDYLVKPLNMKHLASSVRQALDKSTKDFTEIESVD